jgi:hypothetical protein
MNPLVESLYHKASAETTDHHATMQRFAELVVQECLKQCYYRGMNDELYAGQLKAAAFIEEQFRVNVILELKNETVSFLR